jgi:hypothetical protein
MAELTAFQAVDDGLGNALKVLGNVVGTLLASAARTTSVLGMLLGNPSGKGIYIFVNVTAASGTTPTLAIRLNGVDPVTGATYIIQTFTAITAAGEYVYLVYPAAVTAQGGITAVLVGLLPQTWSIDAVIGGTTPSFTFSLSYQLAN